MPKSKAVPLAAFHQEVGGTVDATDADDKLPEGPVATPGSPSARKVWIAEWAGRPELVNGDALAVVSVPGASIGSLDEFKAALDISDRTATRLISRLLEQRLIVSEGRVGVLQPGFPLGSFRYLFPGLWPEAEVLEMPPIGGE